MSSSTQERPQIIDFESAFAQRRPALHGRLQQYAPSSASPASIGQHYDEMPIGRAVVISAPAQEVPVAQEVPLSELPFDEVDRLFKTQAKSLRKGRRSGAPADELEADEQQYEAVRNELLNRDWDRKHETQKQYVASIDKKAGYKDPAEQSRTKKVLALGGTALAAAGVTGWYAKFKQGRADRKAQKAERRNAAAGRYDSSYDNNIMHGPEVDTDDHIVFGSNGVAPTPVVNVGSRRMDTIRTSTLKGSVAITNRLSAASGSLRIGNGKETSKTGKWLKYALLGGGVLVAGRLIESVHDFGWVDFGNGKDTGLDLLPRIDMLPFVDDKDGGRLGIDVNAYQNTPDGSPLLAVDDDPLNTMPVHTDNTFDPAPTWVDGDSMTMHTPFNKDMPAVPAPETPTPGITPPVINVPEVPAVDIPNEPFSAGEDIDVVRGGSWEAVIHEAGHEAKGEGFTGANAHNVYQAVEGQLDVDSLQPVGSDQAGSYVDAATGQLRIVRPGSFELTEEARTILNRAIAAEQVAA